MEDTTQSRLSVEPKVSQAGSAADAFKGTFSARPNKEKDEAAEAEEEAKSEEPEKAEAATAVVVSEDSGECEEES